jgi:hypothetical protein
MPTQYLLFIQSLVLFYYLNNLLLYFTFRFINIFILVLQLIAQCLKKIALHRRGSLSAMEAAFFKKSVAKASCPVPLVFAKRRDMGSFPGPGM